jgi:hypothetical protein
MSWGRRQLLNSNLTIVQCKALRVSDAGLFFCMKWIKIQNRLPIRQRSYCLHNELRCPSVSFSLNSGTMTLLSTLSPVYTIFEMTESIVWKWQVTANYSIIQIVICGNGNWFTGPLFVPLNKSIIEISTKSLLCLIAKSSNGLGEKKFYGSSDSTRDADRDVSDGKSDEVLEEI